MPIAFRNRDFLSLTHKATSLVASNAALVAIFSHNSAAENAQKEAKGKGRETPTRPAMQTTPERNSWEGQTGKLILGRAITARS